MINRLEGMINPRLNDELYYLHYDGGIVDDIFCQDLHVSCGGIVSIAWG
jgi:hypothetical protein